MGLASWPPGGPGRGSRRIIDTHAHDVPLSRKLPSLFLHLTAGLPATAPSAERLASARLPDLIEDMERARVRTSLVVLQEETGEFFRLAAQHPGRLYGLAYYDSRSPEQGLAQVRTLCDGHPELILGVATVFSGLQQDPRLADFAPLYEYCLRRDLPIQFHTRDEAAGMEPGGAMALAVLARSYPRLKIVGIHAGGWNDRLPGLLDRCPNLFLQADALQEAEAAGHGAPRCLRTLLRTAGSRRLMFGSHWHGREERYLERVEAVQRLTWWQRANLGWRTAIRVYGPRILPLPSSR